MPAEATASAEAGAPADTPAGTPPGLEGFEPLTAWRAPPIELPEAKHLNYTRLAEEGTRQTASWARNGWYCERLGCPGPWPGLTLWGEVPMFEAADALQLAHPSHRHRKLVNSYAIASERYWDPAIEGSVPLPEGVYPGVEAYFDDNGWLGIAYYEAYRATGRARYLRDARHAFRFAARKGWDKKDGGGMWWNTSHPYHSGPALAADSLLGILLYQTDEEGWQLHDVQIYVNWANRNDTGDGRGLYLDQPNEPEGIVDYVQAPLVYVQYELCQLGLGDAYCEHAGRLAATLAEQNEKTSGYEYNQGPEYDAIFMHWMVAYGQASGDPYWHQLAEVNANVAAHQVEGENGLWLGSWWGGPIEDSETAPGMFRTMAATTSLFAWLSYYDSPRAEAATE